MNRYLKKLKGYAGPRDAKEKLDISRHDPEDEEMAYGSSLPKDIPMESGMIQSVMRKIKKYASNL